MLTLQDGRTLYYGKGDVLAYRTYAAPLAVPPVPESAYEGDRNVIFAHNVRFAVSGERLLASFAEGDNALVVATDSMKNFILRESAGYEGATTEGYLAYLSGKFLAKYPHIAAVEIAGSRIPFHSLDVPSADGFAPSGLVYRRSHNDRASATLGFVRGADGGARLVSQRSALTGLQLIKVTGSSFHGFIRDEYTTLPESYDRPLFIYLDIHWTYGDPEDAFDAGRGRYVAAEQVADIAHAVFHENVTPSIQHLIYRIGRRVLARFPQVAEVGFESNNRTWETVVDPADGSSPGVFTEPRPPYGFQGFTMTRADAAEGEA